MSSPGSEDFDLGRVFGLVGSRRSYSKKPHVSKRTAALSVVLVASVFAAAFYLGFAAVDDEGPEQLTSRSMSTLLLPVPLIHQHKDTPMPCVAPFPPCPMPVAPHAWNDAKGPDGVYGTADDCPHCSCYCAPASIAMIATYRGVPVPMFQQDDIYDAGKASLGDVPGDKILGTHGVGMFDGTGGLPPEVQNAMTWAVGPIVQHNQGDASALTDYGGWPGNMSAAYPGDPSGEPPTSYRYDQGHAKVIGGYEDNGTADFIDDLCLIYDPWPEYTDMNILPTNASLGPGGTYDPYWLPLNDVNLADIQDIYLVDTYPDVEVGELGGALVPVALMLIAVVACLYRRRR